MTIPFPPGPEVKRLDLPFAGLPEGRCFVPGWRADGKRYWLVNAKECGRSMHAHRMAAMLLLGNLISPYMVLHRCGNPNCLHPDHLYVGGPLENHRDKILHQLSKANAVELASPAQSEGVDILMPMPLTLSREASLLPAFSGFFPDTCFLAPWLPPTNDGYCQLSESSKSGAVVGAHRKIHLFFNGPLDKYDIVDHTCGDNKCLNPYHLFKSGQQESRRDFNVAHDERCTVTESDMKLIRNRSETVAGIAGCRGIHEQTVGNLRRAALGKLRG